MFSISFINSLLKTIKKINLLILIAKYCLYFVFLILYFVFCYRNTGFLSFRPINARVFNMGEHSKIFTHIFDKECLPGSVLIAKYPHAYTASTDQYHYHAVPGHFAERRFAERQFADGQFVERTVCRRTFCRMNNLPKIEISESQSFCEYSIVDFDSRIFDREVVLVMLDFCIMII